MRKKLTSLSLFAFLGFAAFSYGQTKGIINDGNGFPEADVQITIKGSDKVAYTDENGEFDIDAKIGDILIINGKEYVVSSNHLGVIKLQSNSTVDLAETVVTAFGVQKKETVVGSVGTISAEDIENRPLSNVAKALDGAVAGASFYWFWTTRFWIIGASSWSRFLQFIEFAFVCCRWCNLHRKFARFESE